MVTLSTARSSGVSFKWTLFLLLWLIALSHFARADVILHAFNWKYAEIADKAGQIAENGYKIVMVSPPLKSSGHEWWARYQPQDYRVIDNPLGNTHDFRAMIQALADHQVVVYADIVLNHMANEAWMRPGLDYPGERILAQYRSAPDYYEGLRLFGNLSVNLFSAWDFHAPGRIMDYRDRWQVQNLRLSGAGSDPGLPDLAANPWVVEQQQTYLKSLKAMGVRGFRVDAAKHMSSEQINRVFTPEITQGMHVFGEIITQGGAGTFDHDVFLKPYLEQTSQGAYDFPLFFSTFHAMKPSGSLKTLVDPGAYGQALPSARAITFVITHDIPNNDGFRYLVMDPVDEKLAYAYILGRDGGTPMVFSDHNESGHNRWVDAYDSPELVNMVRFHNRVQGQPMTMLAYNDCALLFSRGQGQGIVGINKCGFDQEFAVDGGAFGPVQYLDMLHPKGSALALSDSIQRFRLPARSAAMWLADL